MFVALELSSNSWKLAFSSSSSSRVRLRNIAAGALQALEREIALAKAKFGLDENAPIQTCYEAGRDGHWLHRALLGIGINNFVIESSCLEVDRRQKQRKTDRLDAMKMVHALIRYCRGERSSLRVNHVPGAEDEDIRNLQRELQTIRSDRTRINNRIKGLLVAQGIRLARVGADFPSQLAQMTTGDGQALGEYLTARLRRDFARMQLCVAQIRELEKCRAELFRQAARACEKAASRQHIADRLIELRGIGAEGAWTLSTELFAWREFANRRQVGAVVGLTPTHYSSGKLERELGISKAGRGELRSLLVELAWLWLQYQPQSDLTRWYHKKVTGQGSRIRRIAIVALARKLLVALWKYAMQGEIPGGANFKTDKQKRRLTLTPSMGDPPILSIAA
jgi:transposase